ncbi:hypothetical protein IEN92_03400 [Polynucleobacter sp. MWH-Creno-3A4]|nr:hypothetical protein [Polynucleobacter sp. MWH-Creno-3A4]MBU3605800.1 hypothetical protein [Polynucleobacter sp. MWH-Creno-3A4]
MDVLSIYRNATILSYQEDGGEVKAFDLSDIGAKTYPIDPLIFSAAKE